MTIFAIGDRVLVQRRWPSGHVRTPAYIRGHAGRIVADLGVFANSEELAYRRSGLPARALYRVRFRQQDLWPGYGGGVDDTLDVEIYDHWLEAAN